MFKSHILRNRLHNFFSYTVSRKNLQIEIKRAGMKQKGDRLS
jgi:hypothetical protein